MDISLLVSIGEALDKYSILRLKEKYITNFNPTELNELKDLEQYINPSNEHNVLFEYKCLYEVNEIIWGLMDMTTGSITLETAQKIFRENDARYRIKKKINEKASSHLKEFKSYNSKKITFTYPRHLNIDLLKVYKTYLEIYYDEVQLEEDSNINTLEKQSSLISLEEFYKFFNPKLFGIVERHVNSMYTTRNYVSGHLLGDLIHALYVVKCDYLSHNRKGIVYIENNNIDKQRMYDDLYSYIEKLPYIVSFKIVQNRNEIGEYIDLDSWMSQVYSDNWIDMLKKVYLIDLYSIPWIYSYNNIIDRRGSETLIHRSLRRHTSTFPWEELSKRGNFISFTSGGPGKSKEYDIFPYKTNTSLILCDTVEEFIDTIKNCPLFICNQTSLLAIAMAMYLPCLCELHGIDAVHYIGLEKYNKNLKYNI